MVFFFWKIKIVMGRGIIGDDRNCNGSVRVMYDILHNHGGIYPTKCK